MGATLLLCNDTVQELLCEGAGMMGIHAHLKGVKPITHVLVPQSAESNELLLVALELINDLLHRFVDLEWLVAVARLDREFREPRIALLEGALYHGIHDIDLITEALEVLRHSLAPGQTLFRLVDLMLQDFSKMKHLTLGLNSRICGPLIGPGHR